MAMMPVELGGTDSLPADPLTAAQAFHADVLPRLMARPGGAGDTPRAIADAIRAQGTFA